LSSLLRLLNLWHVYDLPLLFQMPPQECRHDRKPGGCWYEGAGCQFQHQGDKEPDDVQVWPAISVNRNTSLCIVYCLFRVTAQINTILEVEE
jgi:hypothetical protein